MTIKRINAKHKHGASGSSIYDIDSSSEYEVESSQLNKYQNASMAELESSIRNDEFSSEMGENRDTKSGGATSELPDVDRSFYEDY